MSSNKKKLLLAVVLLIAFAIPASVAVVLRQQQLDSNASQTAVLSITPATLSKTVGDEFTVDVVLDTKGNQVTGASVKLTYTNTALQLLSIEQPGTPFMQLQSQSNPGDTNIAFISVHSDPVTGSGSLATLRFKALAPTNNTTARISFDPDPTFTSVAGLDGTNVLSGTTPATVTVAAVGSPTAPTSGTTRPITPSPVPSSGFPNLPTGTSSNQQTSTQNTSSTGTGGTGGRTITPTIFATTPIATLTATTTPRTSTLSAQTTLRPTVAEIPVTADVTPTTLFTVAGGLLLGIGVFSFFVL